MPMPNGGMRLLTTKRLAIRDHSGQPQYLLAIIEDVTERRRSEERIAHLAHHDPLTNLPNRAAFTEHLASTLNRAEKAKQDFAVLCIDLDRFKEVNDVFGHSVGDELLVEVSRRLKDVAGDAFLARLAETSSPSSWLSAPSHRPPRAWRIACSLALPKTWRSAASGYGSA
jgi:predicted signal transduction protein with EAL and GGDEF domain